MNELTTEQLQRLALRRRPAQQPRVNGTVDDMIANIEDAIGTNELWSEYQDRLCRRGKRMRCDARGLPPGYAQGPTWLRAAAERAAHPSTSTH